MKLNYFKKSNAFIPSFINHKVLGNLYKFNTNTQKNIIKKKNAQEQKEVQPERDYIDIGNVEYKYCPYLKPLDIKGIKRADRKFDYNSSYAFMVAQNDYKENLKEKNLLTKYLYNGMKVPLPPKRYKISEYVDIRLDMFSPVIIWCVICFPFFFTGYMWSIP
ncbi:conserved Plasmodium protein, unknown function [Plasmodium malariae]|uniref:Uncharacterized protein n=1 Tax=Plasmodium malariae TaxID=5858 RepID=A0A1C3L0U1_PLAMA|nr:conserved Plasmodium protein, unknown function [Plasmodium malariae]